MTTCLGEIIYFIDKVNVAVAVGHQLWIIIAVVVRQYAFAYILYLNKKIQCFAMEFILLRNEKSWMLHQKYTKNSSLKAIIKCYLFLNILSAWWYTKNLKREVCIWPKWLGA